MISRLPTDTSFPIQPATSGVELKMKPTSYDHQGPCGPLEVTSLACLYECSRSQYLCHDTLDSDRVTESTASQRPLPRALQFGRVSATEECETLCYWKWTGNPKYLLCDILDSKLITANASMQPANRCVLIIISNIYSRASCSTPSLCIMHASLSLVEP